MKNLIDPALENYCVSKSSHVSEICEALADDTIKNVSGSQMLIGNMEASVLQMLIQLAGVKRVLEFGTYTGYSALAMAEALPEGGEVVTLDINQETLNMAKKYWAKSSHGKKITSMMGRASESLKSLKGNFDMLFIDADKGGYLHYLKAGKELLSPKGFIVADNCLWSGRVLKKDDADHSTKALQEFNDFVSSQTAWTRCLLPVRDGMFIIRPN